jgi:hypothetical protein
MAGVFGGMCAAAWCLRKLTEKFCRRHPSGAFPGRGPSLDADDAAETSVTSVGLCPWLLMRGSGPEECCYV